MTTTASSAIEYGIASLQFTRRYTSGLVNDFPMDRVTYQPIEGCNHLLWQIGHLATTDDWFRATLTGGKQDLESWNKLFGGGSEPQADASAYPSFAEVRAAFDQQREKFESWVRSMSEDDLARPMPEELKTFAATYGEMISNLAAHEGMHAGQICVLRKGLGLKRVFF